MADVKVANGDASLYERDFLEWTQKQAAALRSAGAGGNAWLDYGNLAEEIEALGGRDRRELSSRMTTVIEHLLKLEFSPATEPRAGWITTIGRERLEIEFVLADSPSLRRQVAELLPKASTAAARLVARELELRGEDAASTSVRKLGSEPRYLEEEVLGEWFPEFGRDKAAL